MHTRGYNIVVFLLAIAFFLTVEPSHALTALSGTTVIATPTRPNNVYQVAGIDRAAFEQACRKLAPIFLGPHTEATSDNSIFLKSSDSSALSDAMIINDSEGSCDVIPDIAKLPYPSDESLNTEKPDPDEFILPNQSAFIHMSALNWLDARALIPGHVDQISNDFGVKYATSEYIVLTKRDSKNQGPPPYDKDIMVSERYYLRLPQEPDRPVVLGPSSVITIDYAWDCANKSWDKMVGFHIDFHQLKKSVKKVDELADNTVGVTTMPGKTADPALSAQREKTYDLQTTELLPSSLHPLTSRYPGVNGVFKDMRSDWFCDVEHFQDAVCYTEEPNGVVRPAGRLAIHATSKPGTVARTSDQPGMRRDCVVWVPDGGRTSDGKTSTESAWSSVTEAEFRGGHRSGPLQAKAIIDNSIDPASPKSDQLFLDPDSDNQINAQSWCEDISDWRTELKYGSVLSKAHDSPIQYYCTTTGKSIAELNQQMNGDDMAVFLGHGHYWHVSTVGAKSSNSIDFDGGEIGKTASLETRFFVLDACSSIPSPLEPPPTDSDDEPELGPLGNAAFKYPDDSKLFSDYKLHGVYGFRTESFFNDDVQFNFGLYVGLGIPILTSWMHAVEISPIGHGGRDVCDGGKAIDPDLEASVPVAEFASAVIVRSNDDSVVNENLYEAADLPKSVNGLSMYFQRYPGPMPVESLRGWKDGTKTILTWPASYMATRYRIYLAGRPQPITCVAMKEDGSSHTWTAAVSGTGHYFISAVGSHNCESVRSTVVP